MDREKRITYLAIAELNEQKRMKDMEVAVENALIHVLNEFVKTGR